MGGTQILQPEVTISLANADLAVSNFDQKVLLIGQKLSGGTAPDGVLVTNISSSGAPENGLFGESSMAAEMVRRFKVVNPVSQLDAIPLDDDGAGVPRQVTITIVGTATAAGTLIVVAGSEKQNRFEIAVASGDTPTIIALAIETAINADTKGPFTAGAAVGVVTLTADNDGTVANDLGVETSGTVAGVTGQAVAETVAGATDPTLTGILDVATSRYQAIIWPYLDVTVVKAFLDARFNSTNEILDGMAFIGTVDTLSNHLTALNLQNSESLTFFNDKVESEINYIGPAQNEPTYSKSAQFAAARSLRLTQDASISRFITSSASLDQFGGPALASLPYFNTPLPDLPIITEGRGWTQLEIKQLFDAGGSVMGVNASGTSALVGEVKTTFKTDTAGNPDPTFGLLNLVDTASNVREYFFNNLKARFVQSRLTEGPVSRGRDQANEIVIRAFNEKLYQDLAGPNFVLVQDGEPAIVFFKDNLVIVLDLATGKVTITMQVPIVTQLRTIIITIKIAFSTTG